MITNVVTCKCRQELVFATKADGSRDFPDRLVHIGKAGACKRSPSNPAIARAIEGERLRLLAVTEIERQNFVLHARKFRLNDLIETFQGIVNHSERIIDDINEERSNIFDAESEDFIFSPEGREQLRIDNQAKIDELEPKIKALEKDLGMLEANLSSLLEEVVA